MSQPRSKTFSPLRFITQGAELFIRGILLTVLFLTACTRRPVLSSVPPIQLDSTLAKVAPDSVTRSANWLSQIYRPGIAYYQYSATSTVELSEFGSLKQTDSSRISAVLTVSLPEVSSQGLQLITTRAESLSIFTQPSLITSTRPTEEHSAILTQKTQKVQITRQDERCTQQTNEFLFRGDELIPIVLRENTDRLSWMDTTNFQICRGGIQLQITRVTHYHVDTQSISQSDLRITRSTTAQIHGQGFQWQQPIQAVGQLTGMDTLIFASSSRRLSSIHGTAQLELEFRSSHRVQNFRQSTNTAIRARL